MKNIFFATMLIVLYSCANSEKNFEKSQVLERIGGGEKTPEWANGSKVAWSEGPFTFFVSVTSMGGGARTSACMDAASIKSKSEILSYVKQGISTSGQLSQSGVENDPSFESLTAFLSQGKISGVNVVERYWEKSTATDESGQKSLRIDCAAKAKIKTSDLLRQIRESMGLKGNPEIREKLIEAQKSFIENL